MLGPGEANIGDDPALGGLDLVRVDTQDGRDTLWLTARARAARSA